MQDLRRPVPAPPTRKPAIPGLVVATVLLALAPTALAAAPLQVAIKDAPPFAFRDDGRWVGIATELWERVALDLGLDFEFVEVETATAVIDGLAQGTFDAGVGALSLTPDREDRIDFSHAFFSGGLGAAVSTRPGDFLSTVRRVISRTFLTAVLGLLVLLLLVGIAMWLAERRRNPEEFPPEPLAGLGAGLWWAAVTMTTVGYGDKAPKTTAGRGIGLVWMFASLLLLGGYVAAFASALTAGQLEAAIEDLSDLEEVDVAVLRGTVGESWSRRDVARDRGLRIRVLDDIDAALDALAADEVAAVVHDRPLLRYAIRQRPQQGMRTLDRLLTQEPYGFGLPQASPLRDGVNRSILEATLGGDVADLVTRYLGDGD